MMGKSKIFSFNWCNENLRLSSKGGQIPLVNIGHIEFMVESDTDTRQCRDAVI